MVAIIIVNYKSDALTIRFVREELSKTRMASKVVIVNNAATPESDRRMAEELDARVVTDIQTPCPESRLYVLHSEANLGFARGCNLGAEFARRTFQPDLLLFSNNDIEIVDTDVLEQLAAKLDEDPRIGMIGPCVVGKDGRRQSPDPYLSFWTTYVRKPLLSACYSEQKRRRVFRSDYTESAPEGFCDKVIGAFMMVRADDFFACGMMDPRTFLYYEELILAERMGNAGKKPYFYPAVTVIHAQAATIGSHYCPDGMMKLNLDSAACYYHHYRHVPMAEIALGRFLYLAFRKMLRLKNKLKGR